MIYDVAEINVGVLLGSGGYGSVYSGTTERIVKIPAVGVAHIILPSIAGNHSSKNCYKEVWRNGCHRWFI